jgi:hypothetical protein
MNAPKVKRLVLYKHGIAYVERRGPADAPFELTFTQGEMADILKSFTAWVQVGTATVGWVGFDKPEDPVQALLRKNLNLDLYGTLVGLLGTLTGRRVQFETAAGAIEGIFTGIDPINGQNGAVCQRAMLQRDAAIHFVDLAEVRSMQLLEKPSQANVDYFLDRKRAAYAGENKTITVDVKGNAEELGVSYIVPAPTWRVSYRIVLEQDSATFMGWGIVHNPLEDDIEDVELTLTTGQPNSFVIDLYNPKEISRTVVEERARVAPMPAMMAPGMMSPRSRSAASMVSMDALDEAEAPMAAAPAAKMDVGVSEQAAMQRRGEFFEYRVKTPVSMRNGGSAMVPLFARKGPVKKERAWWVGSSSGTPDIMIRFKNETGAVLEEGPAVIYDDATYAGEAMVRFRARGADVALSFAKDLGLKCSATLETQRVFVRVQLGRGALVEEYSVHYTHTLLLRNEGDAEASVMFYMRRHAERTLTPDGPKAEVNTSEQYGFRVTAAAGKASTLAVEERSIESRAIVWKGVTAAHLQNWRANKFLDDATIHALVEVQGLEAQADYVSQERDTLREQTVQLSLHHAQLREQLGVLKEGGEEGAMRLRVVKDMEETTKVLQANMDKTAVLTKREATLRSQAHAKLEQALRPRS